jgi:hypothetical protein
MRRAKRVVLSEREARYWAAAATRELRSMLEPAGLFCLAGKLQVLRVRTTRFRKAVASREEVAAMLIGTYTPQVSETQVFEDLWVWLKDQQAAEV